MSDTERSKPGDEDELELAAETVEDLDAEADVKGGGLPRETEDLKCH